MIDVMVWYGVVWCGVVWCGVVWRGVAWRFVFVVLCFHKLFTYLEKS